MKAGLLTIIISIEALLPALLWGAATKLADWRLLTLAEIEKSPDAGYIIESLVSKKYFCIGFYLAPANQRHDRSKIMAKRLQCVTPSGRSWIDSRSGYRMEIAWQIVNKSSSAFAIDLMRMNNTWH